MVQQTSWLKSSRHVQDHVHRVSLQASGLVRCTEDRPSREEYCVGNRPNEAQPSALHHVCGGKERLRGCADLILTV